VPPHQAILGNFDGLQADIVTGHNKEKNSKGKSKKVGVEVTYHVGPHRKWKEF
jgi:hypothetical protein